MGCCRILWITGNKAVVSFCDFMYRLAMASSLLVRIQEWQEEGHKHPKLQVVGEHGFPCSE